MWRQEDICAAGKYGANPVLGVAALERPEQAGERALAGPRQVYLIPTPLMHAVGHLGAFQALSTGGVAALLPSRRFDAVELWKRSRTREGDPHLGRGPAVLHPDAGGARRPSRPLGPVVGEGDRQFRRDVEPGEQAGPSAPHAARADRIPRRLGGHRNGSVDLDRRRPDLDRPLRDRRALAVFTDDGRRVEPGSGERGRVAVGGAIPRGYYKDEKKTADTFRTIEGRRWSMPGDWATVETDGTLTLLGRGAECINTGGEKVFPEEVEEALKRHPAVRDAAVVGLPDPRFGEVIWAVVELRPPRRHAA